MTDNYTILQKNVLNSLQEHGQRAFLWACDRRNADRLQYKAESFAREVDYLVQNVEPMLDLAGKPFENSKAVIPDLMQFLLRRHCYWRFPNENNAWL